MRPFRPVVFAGVSLTHAEIRDLVDAECRPPIRTGDLDRLRGAQRTIVIIDGELAGDAITSVDEIERAISRGFDVRGASSIGALRAEGIEEEKNPFTHPMYDTKARGARYLLHRLNTG